MGHALKHVVAGHKLDNIKLFKIQHMEEQIVLMIMDHLKLKNVTSNHVPLTVKDIGRSGHHVIKHVVQEVKTGRTL
jgi:hypothetical protein